MKNYKVFTKTNLILSGITIAIFLTKFFEMLFLFFEYNGTGIHIWEYIALGNLIFLIYTILFAYLSRVVGIRKGIKNGYIWGLCLGVLGFIVVCALKEDTNVSGKNNIDNKYDEIEKLNGLKIKGVLTEEEFEIEKNKILKDFKY